MNPSGRHRFQFVPVLSLALLYLAVSAAIGAENPRPSPGLEPEITRDLGRAVAGLLYMSESDEPLEVVCWAGSGKPIEARMLLELARRAPDTPVETVSLDGLFEGLTIEREWYGAQELATMRRYRKLYRLLDTRLSDVRVFRVGTLQVGIYVIGVTPRGNWAGVRTTSIET